MPARGWRGSTGSADPEDGIPNAVPSSSDRAPPPSTVPAPSAPADARLRAAFYGTDEEARLLARAFQELEDPLDELRGAALLLALAAERLDTPPRLLADDDLAALRHAVSHVTKSVRTLRRRYDAAARPT